MGLGFGLCPSVRAGKGPSECDDRPGLDKPFVELDVDQLIDRYLFSWGAGVYRTHWKAQATVNALFGMDHQHAFAVVKNVDATDFNAICALAQMQDSAITRAMTVSDKP